MAKMITRTVTVYTYVFGKFNPDTMTVEGMEKVTKPYKMGERETKRHVVDGKLLLSVKEDSQLYGMTIEDFVKYAKPVDAGTAEGGETN